MPSDRDPRAAVEALADEWDAVSVVDEWDAADRWAAAPARLRAILAEHPAKPAEPDAGGEGLTAGEREAIENAFDHNPHATGDWLITRKEWRQLFGAVAHIMADRERRAEARGAERALQEAAADFAREWPVYGDDWLRDRADRIAGEGR